MTKTRCLITLFFMGATVMSCIRQPKKSKASELQLGHNLIFSKGEKASNETFTGTVWVSSLVLADSVNQNAVGSVTFEPGARTNWHLHPNGQIILALEGEGYYQEKGRPKKILYKGDVVKCPANIPHWHGASLNKQFIQIAITGREKGSTQWQKAVSDEEYSAGVK